jgi:hypothetical protein
MMAKLAARYPGYGWERNQGYATREHRDAIRRLGLTPFHRRSFLALQRTLAGDQISLDLFEEGATGLDQAPDLADDLALLGRRDDARRLFERLLSLRNDVGLLAEEYDPHARRQLGNFPQAFSHVALIDTAFNLSRTPAPHGGRPAEQRAGK